MRIGYFHSNSSRAVELLTQKAFQQGLYSNYELYQFQAQAGSTAIERLRAFSSHLRDRLLSEEDGYLKRCTGKSYLALGASQIRDAAYQALYAEGEKSVINVAGQTIWEDNQKGQWPEYLYRSLDEIGSPTCILQR